MTMIVVGTFLFFGAHTILWFARSAYMYVLRPEGVQGGEDQGGAAP
jgi:hypothetical protein